ncbi:MAG: glycosyltransferase family 2 protein [Deltaproteobacteria bacterium]|nr:glycosyltransferase family 2 protein [Deltaproteobacteria bacterium]
MAAAVFWGAIGMVVYVYVGYPCLIFLLAWLRPRPVRKAPQVPTVSFIIAAYNEETAIADKLANTLALDYPTDKLEVIVASDGSTDRTDEIVRTQFADRVRLLHVPGRVGKTITQNRAVAAATGEILAFSDTTTVYRPESLQALVAHFADPEVGSVTGSVIYGVETAASVDQGRALYWNYESFLRRQESRFHSVLGNAGCCYALRRRLYTPLAADMISDVAQAIKVVQQGYRAVVADDAFVYEPAESRTIGSELRRRARVITRGLRSKWAMRAFFNPLRHPWFTLQVLSHRVLRWAVPIFLLIALAANAFLLHRAAFRWLFVAQLGLYALGGVAYALEERNVHVPGLTIPLYFCVVNVAPLLALRALLRGERAITWETGPP